MIDQHFSHTVRRRRYSGNAIVEYVMPGALVLVGSISLIAAIGAGLNGQFGTIKKDMSSKISAAQAQENLHNMQKNAFEAAASAATKTGGTSGNGAAPSANMAGLKPDDIAKIIQTAGANGATETLADALTKYAEQLKASGNLTPDQANILAKLANEGHNLAGAEKALQDAVSGGQGTVNYNGKSYSVSDFSAQFGMTNGISGVSGMSSANANPQMAPFLSLYEQAKSSGAMNDSAVSNQVSYLSQQITALSELAKTNIAQGVSQTDQSYAYTTANAGGSYGMGLTAAPDGTSISGQTHSDSSGICAAGSGAGCH